MTEANKEIPLTPRPLFSARTSIQQVEEGNTLAPRFDDHGLILCVTTDSTSKEVLMVGYMTAQALTATIRTGEAHYWSRSRQCLWHKGATSGLVQKVVEMRIDDDQDAIWLAVAVSGHGASCHVGYRSCFYREVPITTNPTFGANLVFKESEKVFDPEQVYAGLPNPTRL